MKLGNAGRNTPAMPTTNAMGGTMYGRIEMNSTTGCIRRTFSVVQSTVQSISASDSRIVQNAICTLSQNVFRTSCSFSTSMYAFSVQPCLGR